MSPMIPTYERKYSLPGEVGEVKQNVAAAGMVGNEISQFGAQLGRTADILQQRADALKKQQLVNQAESIKYDMDNDFITAEGALKTLKGDAALNSKQWSDDTNKAISDKYLTDTTDPNLRPIIQQHLDSRANQLYASAVAHHVSQLDAVSKSVRDKALDTVGRAVSDGTVDIEDGIQAYTSTILAQYGVNAISDNKLAEDAIIDGSRKIAKTAINGLMVRNPMLAVQTIESGNLNKYFTGDEITALKKEAIEYRAPVLGASTATEVFQEDPKASIQDMQRVVKERLKDDPKAMTAGLVEIKSLYQEQKDALTQAVKDAKSDVYSYIAKAQLSGKIPTMKDVPPEVWKKLYDLDPKEIDTITDEFRREAEHQMDRARMAADRLEHKNTEDKLLSLQTWGNLVNDTEALKNADLSAMLARHEIQASQYQDLVKRQKDVISGAHDPERNQAVRTVMDNFKNDYNNGVFGIKGTQEANLKYTKKIEDFQHWASKNQDKEPSEYYQTTMEPAKKGFFSDLLDSAVGLSKKVQGIDKTEKPTAAPSTATKVLNGITYKKINGQWYAQ